MNAIVEAIDNGINTEKMEFANDFMQLLVIIAGAVLWYNIILPIIDGDSIDGP